MKMNNLFITKMNKTIHKIIIGGIFIFCCHALCMGQNEDNILLKYSLAKNKYREIWKGLLFPVKSIQNHDYQKIINYDTSYSKLDSLYIILPDDRIHVQTPGKTYGCVDLRGIHPLKKIFYQSIPIAAEKNIVVLRCNWFTFIFEKKKGNKYKLKEAYKENYYDFINNL